jgi:hypothetical protein
MGTFVETYVGGLPTARGTRTGCAKGMESVLEMCRAKRLEIDVLT